MAAYTVIEECERSFTSPCSQVGCLHPEHYMRGRAATRDPILSTLDPTPASSSDSDPHSVTAPVSNPQPGSSREREGHAGHLNGRDNKPWEREPDKYVMMRCYRPGYDERSNFKVVVFETPVLITHLRLSEQNAAYEALLARASAHEIPEYYNLQLSRLLDIREAIKSMTATDERGRDGECRADVVKSSTELLAAECVESEEAADSFRAYAKALKGREKLKARLKANKRWVVRLLRMCEREMYS
ncbi:MAG: hypothetical protein ASARMPREDX12_005055 [Alectoria sarmentosa]|nr:MAG: hypothetical protein ASARMPREDX12_005055 [Alectoria sarmentosa]